MVRIILLISILSFVFSKLLGQSEKARIKQIDSIVNQASLPTSVSDSFNFKIDSIEISVHRTHDVIETKSVFIKSQSILNVTLFVKEGVLILAKAIEPSMKKGFTDMYRKWDFYYESNKVLYENFRSTRQVGVATSLNGKNENRYGYNENLSFSFLRKYVPILYSQVQNYR